MGSADPEGAQPGTPGHGAEALLATLGARVQAERRHPRTHSTDTGTEPAGARPLGWWHLDLAGPVPGRRHPPQGELQATQWLQGAASGPCVQNSGKVLPRLGAQRPLDTEGQARWQREAGGSTWAPGAAHPPTALWLAQRGREGPPAQPVSRAPCTGPGGAASCGFQGQTPSVLPGSTLSVVGACPGPAHRPV